MIKMNYMIVLELSSHQKISNDSCVFGYLHANGVIDCPHRGQSMGVRSDATGSLYKMMGIPGIAPLQDDFDAAEHLPGTPCVDHLPSGHLDLDPKVALDAGNRIYRDSLRHSVSSRSTH